MAIAVIVLAAAGYAGYSYFSAAAPAADAGAGRTGRGGGANRPQPVSVAELKAADVPIWVLPSAPPCRAAWSRSIRVSMANFSAFIFAKARWSLKASCWQKSIPVPTRSS